MKEHRPNVIVSSSQSALDVPEQQIRALVEFVAAREAQPVAQADIALVGSEEMAELNRRYLDHVGDTDVLSFDLSEGARPGIEVQLIVCPDVAAREGPIHGLEPLEELLLYVVHGLLHVMGYEDKTVRGYARMRARQEELLAEFLGGPS